MERKSLHPDVAAVGRLSVRSSEGRYPAEKVSVVVGVCGRGKKSKLAPAEELPAENTAAARARGFIRRNARQLDAIIQAAGIQWLVDKVEEQRKSGKFASLAAVEILKRELFPPRRAEEPEEEKPFTSEQFLPF